MEHAQQQLNLVKMNDSNFRLEEPCQDIRELNVYEVRMSK
jgi:hypothetical protein